MCLNGPVKFQTSVKIWFRDKTQIGVHKLLAEFKLFRKEELTKNTLSMCKLAVAAVAKS